MPISDADIVLIDQYLDGTLKDEKLEKLTTKRKNPVFEEVFREHRLLRQVVSEKGRTKLKSKLGKLESEINSETQVISIYSKYKKWMLGAAAAILIGYLGISLYPTHGPNDLYSSYYADYPNIIDPLTKGVSKNPSAYQLYEQKQYKKAIEEFSKSGPSQDKEWYIGLAYLGNKEITKAEEIINSILTDKNHTYHQEAQWYKSLILINRKDMKRGKTLVTSISSNSEHPYATKALRLLKDL